MGQGERTRASFGDVNNHGRQSHWMQCGHVPSKTFFTARLQTRLFTLLASLNFPDNLLIISLVVQLMTD